MRMNLFDSKKVKFFVEKNEVLSRPHGCFGQSIILSKWRLALTLKITMASRLLHETGEENSSFSVKPDACGDDSEGSVLE